MQKIYKSVSVMAAVCMLLLAWLPSSAYAASETVQVTIPVTIIENAPDSRTHGAYQVALSAVSLGAPMPNKAILEQIGAGKVEWHIDYEMPGKYEYKVAQIVGKDRHVVYDESYYHVVVLVDYNQESKLFAMIYVIKNQEGAKTDQISFENTIKKPGGSGGTTVIPNKPEDKPGEEPKVTPPEEKRTPNTTPSVTPTPINKAVASVKHAVQTGDTTTIFLWLVLLLGAITVLIGSKKRRSDEEK